MENKISPKIDMHEVAITAGIVLVGGFIACLAALFVKDMLDKNAKKKSEKKDAAAK